MLPTLSMEQQFIKKLTDVIETNLHDEDFGVSELAAELGMSRITLHRKVKSIIKKSVSEFIREARLKRAYELLHQKTGTVSEIAFNAGFGSVAYFTRCFHKQYGFPPGELLKGMHQPIEEEPNENKISLRTKLRSSKILYALPIVILMAAVLYLFMQNRQRNNIEKSIAILPPVDNSPDDSKSYILEGFREELHIKLDAINELNVVSSTTTENFRNSGKSLKKIAKELKVNYVVEISGQTIGGKTIIRVQLIEAATDKHLWSNPYSQEINEDNIFEIQEDVALLVAKELNASITSKEKRQVTRRLTNNPAAYNFYLQGLDYMHLYERNQNLENICEAQMYFGNAISLDSTFAEAYYRLAYIFIHNLAFINNNQTNDLYNVYLDSGLVLAEKALAYNINDPTQVYQIKADYYLRKGMQELAKENFEKVWQNKTKDYSYYLFQMNYHNWNGNSYEAINNYFKYIELLPDSVLVDQDALKKMALNLGDAGFPESSKKYAEELFNQHHDTLRHLTFLSLVEMRNEDFENSLKDRMLAYYQDTTNLGVLSGIYFTFYHARDFNNAYFWAEKYLQMEEKIMGKREAGVIIAQLYKMKGLQQKADSILDIEIKLCYEQDTTNIPFAQGKLNYALLAGIYSIQGEKKKALECIKRYADRDDMNFWVLTQLKIMPIYDNIRNEPEYIEFIKDMESLYQKEHERVKKLLISNGLEPA